MPTNSNSILQILNDDGNGQGYEEEDEDAFEPWGNAHTKTTTTSSFFSPHSSSSSSSFSSLSSFLSWTLSNGWVWVFVLLVLAMLGFNLFTLLGKGTDFASTLLKPILGTALFATEKAVAVSSEGAKVAVQKSANVLTTSLDVIQQVTAPNGIPRGSSPSSFQFQSEEKRGVDSRGPVGDDAISPIQQGHAKGGWCYIGTDRGTRACGKVGAPSECMSNQVFPSESMCINPSLRP